MNLAASPAASPAAMTAPAAQVDGPRVTRRLLPAQSLYTFGISIDLTLTGIVGVHLAPTRALATLPFSLIPVVAALSTFGISRWIGRAGYRRVFAAVPVTAVVAGLVSAYAVHRHSFALFCVGTALVGVYQAGAGYYRYAAAEANPSGRARAVTTLLAGGLVAALVGPFLATAVRDLGTRPYVASYLLVAVFAGAAALWNLRLPRDLAHLAGPRPAAADEPAAKARPRRDLWRQPVLVLGVAATALAAVTMTGLMTAGPVAGMDMGHSEGQAALAVQLHMVGMFAPGLLVARWIGRLGERRVAAIGAVVLVGAGAATAWTDTWAFLVAMTLVGVGWNLASSGGSAMVAASYRPAERGRVQPVAELIGTAAQVVGSLAAGVLATTGGWPVLGALVCVSSVAVAVGLARPVGTKAIATSASVATSTSIATSATTVTSPGTATDGR
ncbi:MFS transporter [Cellulomonas composti]|uniref:MFS transporter n=1 Tax=Cellulomonas composti TaxID=266130 RepID=A0A511J7Q0_9CELL|nr:MFS transporter [Cellulomonas composti]GEL94025.1 MFS transporter [Cellulomonas composti]